MKLLSNNWSKKTITGTGAFVGSHGLGNLETIMSP